VADPVAQGKRRKAGGLVGADIAKLNTFKNFWSLM
jgi:hypothetical protein